MLLEIFDYLSRYLSAFQVFQYLSLRVILSTLTAFFIVFIAAPKVIRWFDKLKIDKSIRKDGPSTHFKKLGTPTMGGMLFVPALLFSTMLWANLDNFYIWIVMLSTLLFALLGCVDDSMQLFGGITHGLRARTKLLWQTIFAFIVVMIVYIWAPAAEMTQFMVPIFKDIQPDLGVWFVPMSMLVIVGTSNAVNLTDGLDGLAILPVVLIVGALGLIAYLVGHTEFSHYLYIPYIAGSGELAVFCGALAGAGLGFLWFNTFPAQIFMGDTGSLALGAATGMVAVITRHELVLVIMGGIFIIEALSVIIQVGAFKLTGKRVFKMAPIHHHFELLGHSEPKLIVRFWIMTFLFVLIGLATLKLR